MSKLRVAVLFGGRSAEHEVSLLSARNVVAALDRERFEPVLVGIDKDGRWRMHEEAQLVGASRDPRLVRLNSAAPCVALDARPDGGLIRSGAPHANELKVDVVFPVLHGPMGEDGTIQGLLELAGLPCVGAGVLGSAIGMDKDVMKRLLRDGGVPIADFRTLRKTEFERDAGKVCNVAAEVGFPLFTKPANLGSSVGIRKVKNRDELKEALQLAFQYDLKALAEAAVEGAREIECSVLGNDEPLASVPGEIIVRHADGFYSYDAKYVDAEGAELAIPARLSPALTMRVKELAITTFRLLECSGMARVDFFLRGDELFVNEINTIPGFTAISMYPKLWEASGLGAKALVSRLIDLALERHGQRKSLLLFYEFDRG